ncbi:MAG: DUF61 family protein [Candidatus Bathyarchaeia archaeon]
MDLPTENWHNWDRLKLRMLPVSQIHLALPGVLYRRLSWKTQHFMHRLVLLTWIGESELARKLWEEEKDQHYFWKMDFEDFLFRVLILKDCLSGNMHPEVSGIVEYLLLEEEDAFKLSTTPLFELLKMDKPHFSSVDGLIIVDFDKQELVRIAKIVPERYQKELRLPLILLRKAAGYMEPYKHIGTKLENLLLQRLLKLTGVPFEKFAKVKEKRQLKNISMLRRRKFNTIYKVLPEESTIWLSTAYENPFFR